MHASLFGQELAEDSVNNLSVIDAGSARMPLERENEALKGALSTALGGDLSSAAIGHYDLQVRTLEGTAQLAAACENSRRALLPGAATRSRRTRIGFSPDEPQWVNLQSERTRQIVGNEVSMAAERDAQTMGLVQLIDETLAIDAS
jgi:hypothetical protein